MLLVVQVGVDLVEVARMAARLLLGGFSSDGRHIGRFVLDAGWIRGRSAVVVKMWRAPGELVRAAVSRPENLELQNGSLPLAAVSPWPCYSAPLQRGLQVGESFTFDGRAIAVTPGCGCGSLNVCLSHAHSVDWRSSSAPKGKSAGEASYGVTLPQPRNRVLLCHSQP
jgi:hypothetical protein